MMSKRFYTVLFLLFLAFPCFARKTVYIDELVLQDWGNPMRNKSVLGTNLKVCGKEYARGIGTHSISRFLINLGGKASSFSGLAGADDHNDFGGNMEFRILADGKLIWSSGIMHKGMPVRPFNVDLKGVEKIALLVTEGGDGIMYDHADWLDAKIITSGEVRAEEIMPPAIKKARYILTPEVPDSPKINNAGIFGARPGNPFQLTIAATGKRPMAFSAENLPDGIELDSARGIIKGVAMTRGKYNIVVHAKNESGADSKVIRIDIGDDICLTPPMGWNSWNCWGLSVNERKVLDAAKYMHENLENYGWTYINIDDGWEAGKRISDGELPGNEKFRNIKGLCDSIHEMGLKFGIYSSPGPKTCGGYIGSYGYEFRDARTWAGWGVDYLKYDYCYYCDIVRNPTEELIKEPYVLMRKALNDVSRDIVYCVGFGAPNVWHWGSEAGGNLWRTTRDIVDQWNIVRSIGFFQDVCAGVTRPGKYNDPDMLVVGKLGLGWGNNVHDSNLTPDEQYSHVSLWCLLSAPLMIGCDMNHMDGFTLNLLTNTEVLAVDQDPAVMPARKMQVENGQVWYKYLEDGSIAAGFFNVDPYFILWDKGEGIAIQKKSYSISIDLKDLNISGKVRVRDLWRQKDLGVFKDKFSASVPYHGVLMVKFTGCDK
jgi:alpha-galactosidase